MCIYVHWYTLNDIKSQYGQLPNGMGSYVTAFTYIFWQFYVYKWALCDIMYLFMFLQWSDHNNRSQFQFPDHAQEVIGHMPGWACRNTQHLHTQNMMMHCWSVMMIECFIWHVFVLLFTNEIKYLVWITEMNKMGTIWQKKMKPYLAMQCIDFPVGSPEIHNVPIVNHQLLMWFKMQVFTLEMMSPPHTFHPTVARWPTGPLPNLPIEGIHAWQSLSLFSITIIATLHTHLRSGGLAVTLHTPLLITMLQGSVMSPHVQ